MTQLQPQQNWNGWVMGILESLFDGCLFIACTHSPPSPPRLSRLKNPGDRCNTKWSHNTIRNVLQTPFIVTTAFRNDISKALVAIFRGKKNCAFGRNPFHTSMQLAMMFAH